MEITGNKLDFIADKYETALTANAPRIEQFVRNYSQYMGSRDIDGSYVKAKVVRNVTRELIESQIDSRIPYAKVSSQCVDDRHVENARSIERLCDYYVKKLNFPVMNDIDERQTYTFGGSVWLPEFDGSAVEGLRVGGIDVRVAHPKFFTPQPGVAKVEDMDYCFIDIPLPREEIERRYDVIIDDGEGDYAESDESYDVGEGGEGEIILLHVCFYKDEKRNVCEYIWTDDLEILDIDDYYARKVRYCERCGRRAELCEEDPCESPEYVERAEDCEELTEDILDEEGNVLIPAMTQEYIDGVPQFDEVSEVVRDEFGRTVIQNTNGFPVPLTRTVQIPRMKPTVLPFYKPKRFPIVVRLNTSAIDGDWCGVSDCEVIRDQQQTINKLESRAFEKSMRSGTMVAVPHDAEIDSVDNSVYDKVVKLKPQHSKNMFGVINTEVSVSQDINQSDRHYDAAKKISGITNSYTGQADTTAKSGKAKQVQIQQSAGRLESKRVMKHACYAELYRCIFELALAYMDDVRPLCDRDELGGECTIHFNRYAFYKFDEQSGKWFIDADYLFEANYSGTPEDQREVMWELNMANFEKGMFGDPASAEARLRYWIKQERARYPYAYEEVNYYRKLVQAQREAQQAQMMQQQALMAQAQGQPAPTVNNMPIRQI